MFHRGSSQPGRLHRCSNIRERVEMVNICLGRIGFCWFLFIKLTAWTASVERDLSHPCRSCGGLRCALLLQLISRLSKRHIVRHSLEVASNFVLLHGDGFKEQRFPAHIDMMRGTFPLS